MSKHSFEFLRYDIFGRDARGEGKRRRAGWEMGDLIQIRLASTLPIARLVRATCRRRFRRIAGDEACSTRVTLRESYANVRDSCGIAAGTFRNTDDGGGTIIRARFVKLCKA